jgi:hypothetical protein
MRLFILFDDLSSGRESTITILLVTPIPSLNGNSMEKYPQFDILAVIVL